MALLGEKGLIMNTLSVYSDSTYILCQIREIKLYDGLLLRGALHSKICLKVKTLTEPFFIPWVHIARKGKD